MLRARSASLRGPAVRNSLPSNLSRLQLPAVAHPAHLAALRARRCDVTAAAAAGGLSPQRAKRGSGSRARSQYQTEIEAAASAVQAARVALTAAQSEARQQFTRSYYSSLQSRIVDAEGTYHEALLSLRELQAKGVAGLQVSARGSSSTTGAGPAADGSCHVGGSWAGAGPQLGAPEQQAAAPTWQSAAEAPSGHDFEVLWELLEPDDEGPEWEAGLLPRERELLSGADPGLLASRAATALAHFSTVPRAIRRLLRLRPGTLLAGGTFRVALQQPLMVMASFLGCSLPATVVMCAEEPRLMEVPVIQLSAAREAIRTTIRVAWCPYEEDDATAAAATLLLRARPGLALEPASVLLARADTLALLPDWHVLAGLGGGELNRWLNPEDVTTTTAGVAYSRSQSRVSDGHSRGGGMPQPPQQARPSSAASTVFPEELIASSNGANCTEQPPPHAVLTPSDANRLAAAMSVPLHVMLRLLWLRRKRGSCEYATTVLRLRCRHNDAKAALASAASWPRDASPGALAAADLVPSDMDKVTWLLKSREAWEEEAAGFVVWLEHMDATCGRFGAKGASTAHSSSHGTASKSLWRMALEGL